MRQGPVDQAPGGNEDQSSATAPAITVPKGGGAIRGVGEKFAANPVTGTGSMQVPIATSPGRSGFGPGLSLSYDSGAGNGPFGFGWSISLPTITRKTEKGLPQYRDAVESDVFILSGSEDLVPGFKKGPNGDLVRDSSGHPLIDEREDADYLIRRYHPRVEGLFARIERWTEKTTGDAHWRSISRDNILTIYGKDQNSRIADPEDPGRIFSWLICETRDDKGNGVLYDYKAEDGVGVDLTRVHEGNRGDLDDPRRTANRYLKHIRYGNRVPLLDAATGRRPSALADQQIRGAGWMFEVVFDYGEHDADAPKPDDPGAWNYRHDPLSSFRAGFEVRTGRLCERVLMFHHFDGEQDVGEDCLVRSTDFTYSHEEDPESARNPVYTFLRAVTQAGYRRQDGGYLRRTLPPVDFEYTQPVVQDAVEVVDPASLKNLPIGVDGAAYQWTDLHGEGIPGILTEQADAWFYKRNLSPIGNNPVEFAPLELVATKPNLALSSGAQFMDLAGDGRTDLVVLDGTTPGLYEHDAEEGWEPFRPFTSRLNRDTQDPNGRFVDLTGDGHADVLMTEDDALVWYPSLADQGCGQARRVPQSLDEEKGPRLVFADGTQSIYVADFSGDGLSDLGRIRNGEVCYWPNLGYGRFGAKVTMDRAPHFDHPDQFDHKRIRVADIDGSGTADVIYLHGDGVRLYFNQSGNSWSEPQVLRVFPRVDELVSIVPADLLGNGTACLVWSSPLPGDAQRPMRYVNLMGGQKPHLLVKTVNNLGAEIRVQYAPSTKFYLQDKRDGKPWVTRLPFPVHVVERVETCDHISRSRFVTRSAYHHGHFDGEEREFRGFGMVEQFDTEEFAALSGDGTLPAATNIDASSHVPPVLTKTWFHPGAHLGRDHVSDFFAGLLDAEDTGEYYREPGLTTAQVRELLLDDTVMPTDDLTLDEEREACRALKGSMLRQEVFALDGTDEAEHPYTVTEQNFTIRRLQPREGNRHTVFFTHPREAITYHYERDPADPRVQHALTLEVDDFGNVLKEAAIGYGRRGMIRVVDDQRQVTEVPNPAAAELDPDDWKKQTQTLITYTENRVAKDPITGIIDTANDYRTPLPCETRTYEFAGFETANSADRFSFDQWTRNGFALPASAVEIPYEGTADNVSPQKRLIEHVRILYRKDDLTAFLPLGELEPLALPGESYKLALTPGLLAHVFKRKQTDNQPHEELLPNPAPLLQGASGDQGGYIAMDGNWWIASGRVFLDPDADIVNPANSAAQELSTARQHFFLPRKGADPFGHSSTVDYEYDLLVVKTKDAVNNTVLALNAYRVLQPRLVTDPNGNRSAAAFDALGMVVATAVMAKEGEELGDLLEDFEPDLNLAALQAFIDDPQGQAASLLGKASSRVVYDLGRFQRTAQPPFAATLARESHFHDPLPADGLTIQLSLAYSDGFRREIQTKIQAESGDAPQRQPDVLLPTGDMRPGDLVRDGQDALVQANTERRWVGTGRTIFNNKGKPVRQYEPFFSATHLYEPEQEMTDTGVSPVLFYDPVERVVATLHPNHSWEKVVFDPWRQESWDASDTVLVADPENDPDVGDFFRRLPNEDCLPTWHTQREGGALGSQEQAAAAKSAIHAGTPAVAHLDSLGRTVLTVAHNTFKHSDAPPADPPTEEFHRTRVLYDIEGNQREVIDALDRVVMRYDYDLLGSVIHQASMEAGERWVVNDLFGKPIRAWDSRGHESRTEYDPLRRPLLQFVRGTDAANSDPRTLDRELLVEKVEYGEGQANDVALNLRTRVFKQFDGSGIVTSLGSNAASNGDEAYDFKGNLLSSRRQLARDFKGIPDWTDAVPLEDDIFQSSTTYDALNRPTTQTAPDGSVIRPAYNEANLLERVEANLRGALATTPFITNIDYDAKGQRTRAEFGNDVRTTYDYDPLTFRLIRLRTRRGAEALQDLGYTYDPVGNITHIQDDAQQILFFRNRRVEPSNEYTYDALYRLIEAKGREHLGQIGGAPIPHSHDDAPRVGLKSGNVANQFGPNDGDTMGTYVERYLYDAVGNFEKMQHRGSDPAQGWTRSYAYNEASMIEPPKQSDRLSSTTVGNGNPTTEPYDYDPHGNTTSMPHLPLMQWDYGDQLRATAQQVVNSGGVPETTYYVYDAGGQRVRKVTERQADPGVAPKRIREHIYLGGFEIFRDYETAGDTVGLERETLHIMDDHQRIALVETRTQGSDGSPAQLTRYQFGNHLGSASLELDEQAQIISYEEYAPYGSSTYQAVRSQTETAKRYRYTGKERDEASGLYYHGARYYVAWLGRWASTDPIGVQAEISLYAYGAESPIDMVDPSGNSPKRYQDQRGRDTAVKTAAMKKNLEEAKKKGYAPDPMQKRAEDVSKKRKTKKTPIEQHHHKGVKQAGEVNLDPKKMGDPMSSVWSTKRDPMVSAGIGDKPVWDPSFEGKKRTPHTVAKELDLDEQAKGPKTAKGLEDAAAASKQRLPATADLTERARMDWTPIDPKTGGVLSKSRKAGGKLLKAAGRQLLKAAPIVGDVLAVGSALKSAFVDGNYKQALREAADAIPLLGEALLLYDGLTALFSGEEAAAGQETPVRESTQTDAPAEEYRRGRMSISDLQPDENGVLAPMTRETRGILAL